MKKRWHSPILLSLGTVADLTKGKPLAGHDSMCGGSPDVFSPPTDVQRSTDAVVRPV